jgi:hypothetical protein
LPSAAVWLFSTLGGWPAGLVFISGMLHTSWVTSVEQVWQKIIKEYINFHVFSGNVHQKTIENSKCLPARAECPPQPHWTLPHWYLSPFFDTSCYLLWTETSIFWELHGTSPISSLVPILELCRVHFVVLTFWEIFTRCCCELWVHVLGLSCNTFLCYLNLLVPWLWNDAEAFIFILHFDECLLGAIVNCEFSFGGLSYFNSCWYVLRTCHT